MDYEPNQQLERAKEFSGRMLEALAPAITAHFLQVAHEEELANKAKLLARPDGTPEELANELSDYQAALYSMTHQLIRAHTLSLAGGFCSDYYQSGAVVALDALD
jgi:hypothetical protein